MFLEICFVSLISVRRGLPNPWVYLTEMFWELYWEIQALAAFAFLEGPFFTNCLNSLALFWLGIVPKNPSSGCQFEGGGSEDLHRQGEK